MIHQPQNTVITAELEQVMAQQFHTLQQLVEATNNERQYLLKHEADTLIKNAELKEGLLDQMALLEDRYRSLVGELALAMGVSTEHTTLAELMPVLSPENQQWMQRLASGMHDLAHQARTLNDGNEAIVMANMEWIRASQLFLWNMTLPDPTYSATGGLSRAPSSSGMEIRA